MSKPTNIRRNMVLRELSVKFLPNGKRAIFSIKYVDAKGKLRYIPQAFATGLPWSLIENRQQGIQPCDCRANPEGHILPVGIDAILMYNGMEVDL